MITPSLLTFVIYEEHRRGVPVKQLARLADLSADIVEEHIRTGECVAAGQFEDKIVPARPVRAATPRALRCK